MFLAYWYQVIKLKYTSIFGWKGGIQIDQCTDGLVSWVKIMCHLLWNLEKGISYTDLEFRFMQSATLRYQIVSNNRRQSVGDSEKLVLKILSATAFETKTCLIKLHDLKLQNWLLKYDIVVDTCYCTQICSCWILSWPRMHQT